MDPYLHWAPCSGDCSGPLENLDWILEEDQHDKQNLLSIIYLSMYNLMDFNIYRIGAVKVALPGLHLAGSW